MAQAGRMQRAGGQVSRVLLASALHGVLVLGPLLAYLVYQNTHGARVQAGYYRTLAGGAAELTQRFDHLRHLFTYARRGAAAGSEAWLARAQVDDLPAAPLPDDVPADPRCSASPIALALVPGAAGTQVQLERAACAAYALWCACPATPGVVSHSACARPEGMAAVAGFDAGLRAELARYRQADFAIATQGGGGVSGRCGYPARAADGITPAAVAAALGGARVLRVPLADLLPERGRGRFHAMLLLTEDGAVVQASTPGWPGRIGVPAAQAAAQERGWPGAPQARRADLPALYAGPLLVERAGTTQALLCTPVTLPYAQAPALALCGAVEHGALEREARSLPPDLLALVVLLFLLSVCAVPLLKVWLIGPREAFRRADLIAAAAGVVVGAALLTVLLAWAGYSLAWRERLDASTRQVGRQVARAFEGELAQSAGWLDRLSVPGARPELLAQSLPRWGRLMFRLDARGDQVGPLGTAEGTGRLAAPARVGNRAYFRAAQAGPRLPVGSLEAGVEQVVMRGHGVKATALAAPLPAGRGGAAVLIRTFESLEAPVLPPGFVLVVFDAGTGRVLFHSDPERALSEAFYAELDAPALRAHVRSGRDGFVSGEYAAAPHRFHVRPLHADWPWWIAVGREERLWRAAGFDLVAGALPAAALVLAALGAGVLVLAWAVLRAGRVHPGPMLGWLWPRWRWRYGTRAGVLAALVAAGVAAFAVPDVPPLLPVAVLVLAGAAVLIVPGRAGRTAREAPRKPPATGYLACLAAALLLAGVLPAAAVVHDLASWLDAGYQRLVLRTYRSVPLGDAGAFPPGWYLPGGAGVLREARRGAPAPDRDACLQFPGACVLAAGAAPDLADAHVEALRAAAREPLPDERLVGGRRCVRHADRADRLVCAAARPGLWPHGRAGVVLGALALVLAFLVVRLLHGAAHRLFGFELGEGPLAAGGAVQFPATGNVLVVRSPPGYGAQLARELGAGPPALRVRRVDLRAAELDDQGRPRWPLALGSNNDVTILEEFDAGARDPRWTLARLELLERLVFRAQQRVIVLTDVSDPARLALDAADGEASESLAGRWSDVLRELALLRHPPPPAPELRARAPALQVLAEETGWWWRLAPLADALRIRPGFADLSAQAARAEIVTRAWPEYRRLWSLCIQAERLVLAQLAHGGQLNPRQGAVVGQLLRRGLVCRGPEFRLAGEGFALYVRSEVDRGLLAEWERADAGGAWNSWRAPLLVAVLVGGALVFVTQRDTFQAAYALSAAGLAALPALARVLGGLRAGARSLGKSGAAEG